MTAFAPSHARSARMPLVARRGRRARAVTVALVAALSLTACQTTGSGSGGPTPASSQTAAPDSPQAQLAERNARYNQILAEGCVVGAGLGAVMGLVLGGDAESAAIGAGVGAGAGCLAGYGLAEQNLTRSEKEEVLTDRIEVANESVAAYEKELSLTNQIVTKEKAEIKRLRSRIARGQASSADTTRQIAQTNESISIIEESLNNNRDRLANMVKDRQAMGKAGVSTAEMRQKETRMRELLQRQEAALRDLINERDALV
ncbi:hypothetical protein F1188_18385 [Roseospira marina]|uniref:Glycine zipper domain-containing protein n=1 Tax=Roseospira marina TaxID=140057 RepID=A0A5M6I6M6_9PROT|nr:hypothetical protein [Roseospira marina]KAA5603904.1 hypothetical protein F1188_18385 [Roseospira marina]MBB4315965.1 outer membrane lipoprotein SlyB [Roseospira marina]MBB5089165.1 outer membrane lipoprotein SlyB [Roseospira marina]